MTWNSHLPDLRLCSQMHMKHTHTSLKLDIGMTGKTCHQYHTVAGNCMSFEDNSHFHQDMSMTNRRPMERQIPAQTKFGVAACKTKIYFTTRKRTIKVILSADQSLLLIGMA